MSNLFHLTLKGIVTCTGMFKEAGTTAVNRTTASKHGRFGLLKNLCAH